MKIQLQISNKLAKVNGHFREMDVAPFIKNKRTFVPIRFIAENFGFMVDWNEKTQTVTITDEKPLKHKKYYDNPDDCAIDFAMCYMPLSIATNRELSAPILKDKNGYHYTNVYLGQIDAVAIQKKGLEGYVGDAHTHGSASGYKADDVFSSLDKNSTKRNKIEFSYVVTPRGNVKKYTVSTGKVEIVSYDTPFDVKEYKKIVKQYPDVAKNIEYFKEYFGNAIPSVDAEDNKYTTAHLSWCNEADKYIKEFWNVGL